MRICIFSESYEPLLNGVAVSVGVLVKQFRAMGHEVYVVASACPGYHDSDPNVFRVPAIRTWIDPGYPVPIPYFSRVLEKLRTLQLDIVHTQTPWMLGWLGLRVAERKGIPIVSTNHTQYTEYVHYFPLAPKATKQRFIVGLMRRYYNRCNGVIVPSAYVREKLRMFGVHAPMHVIPTGNELDVGKKAEERLLVRRQLGIPEEARVLIYVGRLAREKNLELLLKAFDSLANDAPDLYLLIVGSGPWEKQTRRFASSLDAASRVIFTGLVGREKVSAYYSAGDIFTFPSTTETQGLVLCEALGAGLPCVAVRAGGSPEMLVEWEDSLLSENDVNDFASKIRLLLTDSALYSRMSSNAVVNAARFSTAVMAQRVLQVYEAVLAAGKGPAKPQPLSAGT